MPLRVDELRVGDRVMLNCPKARTAQHREAIFQGVYRTIEEALSDRSGYSALAMGPTTAAFLQNSGAWAAFQLQRLDAPLVDLVHPDQTRSTFAPAPGGVNLCAAFQVEPDGGLREEQGRRVFIERRIVAGQG